MGINNSNNFRAAGGASPAMKALVVLQAITLVAVVGSRSSAPEAFAASPDSRGRGVTLPNAAAQRQEQIRLLEQIAEGTDAGAQRAAESSEALVEKLDAIEQRLAELSATVRRIEANAPQDAAPAAE